MTGEQAINSYTAAYPAVAADLPGQNVLWLQAWRNTGLQLFNEHGFPGLREEEWRYTNLAVLNKMVFSVTDSQTVDVDWLEYYRLEDAFSVVLLNGRFSPSLSRLDGLPDAVTVKSLREVLPDSPVSLLNYLGKAVENTEHTLIAFNSAWFTDGLLVEVAANGHLHKPLQILHVVTEPEALAVSRNLLVVNENAVAEIVETFAGSVGSYFSCVVNEVFLAANAELLLHKVQMDAEKAVHFGGTYLKQAESSRFTHHNFAFGSALARTDIHSNLEAAAECHLNGLYLGAKRQHIDNHTRIVHEKPQGVSREFYKGVLDEKSRGVFQGRVIVAEDAQKTDSQMNNRNLLLSADAEVDTKPQLEIYADDVKCAHGVTVGQLDEKSIFYLQSRGLDESSARNILTFAFANEMVDKVENGELQNLLLKQLLVHFPAINL